MDPTEVQSIDQGVFVSQADVQARLVGYFFSCLLDAFGLF